MLLLKSFIPVYKDEKTFKTKSEIKNINRIYIHTPSQFSELSEISPRKTPFKSKDLMKKMKDLNFNNNNRNFFRPEEFRKNRININSDKFTETSSKDYNSFQNYMDTHGINFNKENQGIHTKTRIKDNIDYLINKLNTGDIEDKDLKMTKHFINRAHSFNELGKSNRNYYNSMINYLTKSIWGKEDELEKLSPKSNKSDRNFKNEKFVNFDKSMGRLLELPLIVGLSKNK